ncbi:Hypothetical predicted protein [Octopus vulgaris]|uniref:Uncharacterized protein n=1 Tax=Octopus vulgaris TaxID=6645 RepID=A0AA36F988_OCTVU|nr:Hypothetical predicted protein [Octopus vulgaris]
MENLPHPKDLDFNQENLAAAWKKWKKEFNLFLIATESDMKPDKVKPSMFLTCIGSKGRDIHFTLDFDSPDEEMNLQTVIEKFDAYCEPRKNITFLRHKFFTCGQAEHQKFDEYVVELRQKAQQCEFGNLTDSFTKDILICGIRDMRLRELREPNLDLQKTIQAGDEICEEMVALLTLPECTAGTEICKNVVNEFSSRKFDISKVVPVTTDGAPSMTGEKEEFVNLFAKEVGHTLSFHWIINEEDCNRDICGYRKYNVEMLLPH